MDDCSSTSSPSTNQGSKSIQSSPETLTFNSNSQTENKDPSTPASSSAKFSRRKLSPLQLEWMDWVRAEFRLRQVSPDEEVTKMMLAHGKRQLQEMERTILLAINRNSSTSSISLTTVSSCGKSSTLTPNSPKTGSNVHKKENHVKIK